MSTPETHPVIHLPSDAEVLDLSDGYDPERIGKLEWAIGRYDEVREAMYRAPQYEGRRKVHMGIDLWAAAGTPVFAFREGAVAYIRDNRREGDYGPTLVSRHRWEGDTLFALHGHLSRGVLERWNPGDRFESGERLAELGEKRENGGWVPHLHFQISRQDPGEADMPGVVTLEDREAARSRFPDPRIILGDIY